MPEDWHAFPSSSPALKALEQAKRQSEQVVLFAPIVLAFREWQNRWRLWKPVAGVFCVPQGQRLRLDPSDLYISQWLTAEMSPDEAELRASLETAADIAVEWSFPTSSMSPSRARRQLVILVSPVFEKRLVLTQRLLRATLVALRDLSDLNRPFAQQVSDELKRLDIPHRLGCSFHGDPIDLLNEGEEPRWGALLCGWDEAMAMTPLEFMALWERRKMLRRHRLQVRSSSHPTLMGC